MRAQNRLVHFGFLAILLLCTACAPSPAMPLPSPTSLPSLPPPTETAAENNNTNLDKLSSRLQLLQQNPALLTGSADDLGKALSLPPNSLLKDDNGRILVSMRVKDASDTAVSALKNAGAQIVNVSAQYGVVTAYVDVKDLPGLAGLPGVLSIQEEMAPQSQGAGG